MVGISASEPCYYVSCYAYVAAGSVVVRIEKWYIIYSLYLL